jgi:hypothetical protein
MKTKRIYRLLPFILIAALPFIISLKNGSLNEDDQPTKKVDRVEDPHQPVMSSPRQNITFILGEDEVGAAPYYSLAYDYYSTNKEARTEFMNTSCRSLAEVRDYLKNNSPANGKPWGIVNLISHGNEWYGMSVPVEPGSKRSSTERLKEYVDEGKFEAVSDAILDDESEIYLHGCGLGNDEGLLKMLSKAFGGKKERPIVVASKMKEYYFSVRSSDRTIHSQLYFAKTWSVYYKFKKRPDQDVLLKEFQKTYPNENIHWEEALNYTNPGAPGDLFHYTINIPINHVAYYNINNGHPDISTQDKVVKFVSKQKELVKIVARSGIPLDKFTWNSQRIYVEDENGNKNPAIKLKGWTTVLCLVKPILVENSSVKDQPFFPEKTDRAYFGRVKRDVSAKGNAHLK